MSSQQPGRERLKTIEGPSPQAALGEAVMAARPSTSEILAEALPALTEGEALRYRRLLEALIACRAGATASRAERIGAAFGLYAEELMTRGEIRDLFGLDLWHFMELESRHGASRQERVEF